MHNVRLDRNEADAVNDLLTSAHLVMGTRELSVAQTLGCLRLAALALEKGIAETFLDVEDDEDEIQEAINAELDRIAADHQTACAPTPCPAAVPVGRLSCDLVSEVSVVGPSECCFPNGPPGSITVEFAGQKRTYFLDESTYVYIQASEEGPPPSEDPYRWNAEKGEYEVAPAPVQEEVIPDGRRNWWGEAEESDLQGTSGRPSRIDREGHKPWEQEEKNLKG